MPRALCTARHHRPCTLCAQTPKRTDTQTRAGLTWTCNAGVWVKSDAPTVIGPQVQDKIFFSFKSVVLA